jgi:protein-export membrane protein SecD
LSGRHVKKASVDFTGTTFQPLVSLELTDEGTKIFADLTKRLVGQQLAIYLDGVPISAPTVQEEITGGKAQISGNFTPEEAKLLAGRLNAGALPVPIELISQQSIGASLGQESLALSLKAGLFGFLAVALFMLLWYRMPGVLAIFALLFYTAIVLVIFKLIPVTLTVAGIAGFILSIGMAVDANILIFERMKEELRAGKMFEDAVREGFGRAWTSIRDSNVSSLITSGILYWLGTSIVQGFALTLGLGILISMFTAITVTRTLLFAVITKKISTHKGLFLSGFAR